MYNLHSPNNIKTGSNLNSHDMRVTLETAREYKCIGIALKGIKLDPKEAKLIITYSESTFKIRCCISIKTER
jgi:hypothetical protein